MIKCSVCGGVLDSHADASARCKYCGQLFSVTSTKAETKSHVVLRSSEGVDVFQKNMNGVLEITCHFPNTTTAGSGLLIDKSGYALTNTHVVTNDSKPCRDITVRLAGQNVRASIIALGDSEGGHGSGVDLALIKLSTVPNNATVIELGNFEDVHIGEQVFVIGNSLGYGSCMTSGIVSDKSRNVGGKQLLMTDCAVNGGNSGGPMFNEQGLVIGVIVSGITGAEGMNFAIPVSTVKKFLEDNRSATKMLPYAIAGYSKPDLKDRKKAKAPCPISWCRSTDTWIENGLFVCNACGFVEGDRIR